MFVANKFLVRFFIVLLLCCYATSALAHHPVSSSTSVDKLILSAEEIAFLEEHPAIHLGIGEEWAPHVIRRPDGTLEGFQVDMIKFLNEATGANIELLAGPWQEIVSQAKSRQIDGLTTSAYSPERAESFEFSDAYLSVFPVFIMAVNNPRQVASVDDFTGFKVAILAENQFYTDMLSDYPGIEVVEFPSEAEAIKKMLEGKVEAAIVASTSYDNNYKLFPRLIRIGHIATERPLQLLYSVRKDWPELTSILNKGIAALPAQQFRRSYNRWFGMDLPVAKDKQGRPLFSEREQAWLAEGQTVRVRIGDYPPLHYFNEEPKGISVDYLNLIAEKAGIKADYLYGIPWRKAIDLAASGQQIDLLLGAMATPARREKILFTKPYISLPRVVFTRENSTFIGSEKDLEDRTLAIEKGFVTEKILSRNYPDIELLHKPTTEDALQAVATGEADAYVGGLMVGTYILRTQGLNNLKVAAPSEIGPQRLSMAVRKDWPELVGIIDKVMTTITPEEHAAIRDKWLPPTRYEFGISGVEVFYWIAGVSGALLATILIILTWNKKLAVEIESRKKTEELLSLSEERYRTLYERSADAMLTIEDNLFVDCNKATVEMLGYQNKIDFLKTAPWQLSPEIQMDGQISKEKAIKMMNEATAKGAHRFEWIHLRANGEEFPVEVLLTAIPVSGKMVLHTVWRDISLKKEVEKVKDELSEDLMRKNVELERFAYTVSHDLKSPLITIQGFLGILKEEFKEKLDDKATSYFDTMNSAATKMYALLNDLLELSRVGRVLNPKETVSVTLVAHEALELLGGRVSETSAVVNIAENLPSVTVDRTRLREVFQNLIENAIKYAHGKPQTLIDIGAAELDGDWTLFVRDNGVGIAPEFHEKVFGLFDRLENDGEGTGVGLAHVRRIIELHGGRIWLESQGDGTGTTFWFTLPDEVS